MKKVIAIDFDGTLTTKDKFVEFIRFAKGTWAFVLGFLCYAPLLVLMKLHLYPNDKAKQKVFAYFFKDMKIEDFDALCQAFAASSRHLLRPQGVEAIRQANSEPKPAWPPAPPPTPQKKRLKEIFSISGGKIGRCLVLSVWIDVCVSVSLVIFEKPHDSPCDAHEGTVRP